MPAVTCPRCGSNDTYRVEEGRHGNSPRWECGDCVKSFFVHATPSTNHGRK
jgi:transposase-like protein